MVFSGLHVQNKEYVRLAEETVLPARSEKLVAIKCRTHNNLVLSDFEPTTVGLDATQLYSRRAKVMPNTEVVIFDYISKYV